MGWRHDRNVMIGSEQEVTGRGGKSQKPLSPSRGGTPSAGSAWDSYLFLPPYHAGRPTVVIRTGNDLLLRVQSRSGRTSGLRQRRLHKFNLSGASKTPCPLSRDLYYRPVNTFCSWPRNRVSRRKSLWVSTCRVCPTASIRRISIVQMASVVRLHRDPVEPRQAVGTHRHES